MTTSTENVDGNMRRSLEPKYRSKTVGHKGLHQWTSGATYLVVQIVFVHVVLVDDKF